MDGLTATRIIRAMDRPDADVPIIAMTANLFAEDVAALYGGGYGRAHTEALGARPHGADHRGLYWEEKESMTLERLYREAGGDLAGTVARLGGEERVERFCSCWRGTTPSPCSAPP